MARYDERGGTGFGADNRDRWREDDRERSSWRSGGEDTSERDDERGFFQRAGDEIRSWFNEDEDDRGPNRDYGRESYGSRPSGDRDNYARSGRSGGGFSSGSSWDRGRSGEFRDRERERNPGRIGSAYSSEDRSSFGGMAQGGRPGHSNRWDRDREQGFGPSRGSGGPWSPSSERSRPSSSSRDFGGFRDESDFRDQRHRGHPQRSDEANRGENEPFGYGKFSGMLGGFGNQTFGSSEHDHYRSWRDRELSKLDRDYDDYCREREHQFNQDFDSWRSKRQSQNPSAVGNASSGDLAAASNAGVGTTTSSMTGTAGAGSEPGSATTQGGTMQSGKTVSTEAADAGRSGSRSRSQTD